MNKIDLSNRVAVMTSGAQGFGFSMEERLSNSGVTVINWDNDQVLMNSLALTINTLSIEVDVTSYDNTATSANAVLQQFNSIAVLGNNAGIAGPSFTSWDYPIKDWKQVIDIDLSGVFYCSKIIVPHMIKANYGRIVNIASIAAKEGNPNAMPYSAAKAGVVALTKSLGKELADKNISVNCVTPAAAKTKIFDQISQEHIDYMLSKIPRGRFLKVNELASMVSWLVSEENSYTTGAVFDLSGGRATY